MKKLYILIIAACLAFSSQMQSATFNITYTGITPQSQAAFEYAAGIWGKTLYSKVPIKVLVHFTAMLPSMLGITFPNGVKDFSGAPQKNTWYPTALANSITGTELNPGQVDIEIYLNTNITWYYDSTGTVPSGSYDFISVALHEMGHGLGIIGLSKKSGTSGSLGLLTASDFIPLTTSFPWPDLDSLPSAFDRHLVNNLNQHLDSFPNPSNALGTILTSNQVYFSGAFTLAANSGNRARIYAPGTFALGSSDTHLDEATYPAGNANELMTPNGTPGVANHDPGPICIGMLKDIGWTMAGAGINNIPFNENAITLYPNPAHDQLLVTANELKSEKIKIVIYNSLGKEFFRSELFDSKPEITISQLPAGIYFIMISNQELRIMKKFIKE